jgi:hypothetical protein
MKMRGKPRLTARQWGILADLLEIAAEEYPALIGFGICESSARILAVVRKLESDLVRTDSIRKSGPSGVISSLIAPPSPKAN